MSCHVTSCHVMSRSHVMPTPLGMFEQPLGERCEGALWRGRCEEELRGGAVEGGAAAHRRKGLAARRTRRRPCSLQTTAVGSPPRRRRRPLLLADTAACHDPRRRHSTHAHGNTRPLSSALAFGADTGEGCLKGCLKGCLGRHKSGVRVLGFKRGFASRGFCLKWTLEPGSPRPRSSFSRWLFK